LDHIVCPQQQRLRGGDSERLRGLQVDYQLEFSRLLDREIGRLCAAEDSVDKGGVTLALLISGT
jgi:hypothetical protein